MKIILHITLAEHSADDFVSYDERKWLNPEDIIHVWTTRLKTEDNII